MSHHFQTAPHLSGFFVEHFWHWFKYLIIYRSNFEIYFVCIPADLTQNVRRMQCNKESR